MRPHEAAQKLDQLASQIDFVNEDYYNLSGQSTGAEAGVGPGQEAWADLTSLTADLAKMRGELYRLGRGVEQLRMPAIEAVGLDKALDQLRRLELRLKPLDELVSKSSGGSPEKNLVSDLLGVLDSLDRVFELIEAQPGTISEGVERGLRSVQKLLLDSLGKYGLKVMELGTEFDPNVHLAMGTESNPGLSNGMISRVLLKGYLFGEKVFRTAQVVVVKND